MTRWEKQKRLAAEFTREVERKIATGATRHEAFKKTQSERPELYAHYLAANTRLARHTADIQGAKQWQN